MDRKIVYPGAIPLDTDILGIQRNAMIALGYALQMVLGTGTVVDGLACTPTSPASMSVNVGQGSMVSLENIDASAFGSLSADTADPLVKMGINAIGATSFTLTAPTTSGQSINYLIEATFEETDNTPVVLPYYNSSNPNQPYSGPSNSGTPQNTVRQELAELQLKAGAAATTGTQATPAVDSGYVGLYIITVSYGQSSVTASNIVQYPTAPFIAAKLPQLRRKLFANLQLYVNSSTGNDSNNGFAPIAAFGTLQGAWNYIVSSLDLNGFNVTVNVANGNYAPLNANGAVVGNTQGSSGILFLGNTASPSSVTITASNAHSVVAENGADYSIAGFDLSASGSVGTNPASGIVTGVGSNVSITGAMVFGAVSGFHLWATAGATITANNVSYTISGGAEDHATASGNGQVLQIGCSITLTGTPAFSIAFVQASTMGLVQMLSATYSGSATGSRYNANLNGVVNTGTGTPNTTLPGNSNGSISLGGEAN